MFGDVYNTTVNVNGSKVFSRTYYPGYDCGCCNGGMFGMNSCFGFGFNNPLPFFAMGIGFAAGYALMPALPGIFKGIGQGFSWVCKGVAKGASAVAKGVKNLWNKIFHKKSKTAKTE